MVKCIICKKEKELEAEGRVINNSFISDKYLNNKYKEDKDKWVCGCIHNSKILEYPPFSIELGFSNFIELFFFYLNAAELNILELNKKTIESNKLILELTKRIEKLEKNKENESIK